MNTFTYISVIRMTKNDGNHLWEKCFWCVPWVFSLAHVLSDNTGGQSLWPILLFDKHDYQLGTKGLMRWQTRQQRRTLKKLWSHCKHQVVLKSRQAYLSFHHSPSLSSLVLFLLMGRVSTVRDQEEQYFILFWFKSIILYTYWMQNCLVLLW